MKLKIFIIICVSILILSTFSLVQANRNQNISPLLNNNNSTTANNQLNSNSNQSPNSPSQGKLPGFNIIDAILGLLTLSVIAFVAPRLKKEE